MDQTKLSSIIFLSGIIVSGISFVMLIVSLLVGKLQAERLKAKLNEEYGKPSKGKG